jgi:hypothetical protein
MVAEDECLVVSDVGQADVVVDRAGAAVVAFLIGLAGRGAAPERAGDSGMRISGSPREVTHVVSMEVSVQGRCVAGSHGWPG